jgi:hypothetical protein
MQQPLATCNNHWQHASPHCISLQLQLSPTTHTSQLTLQNGWGLPPDEVPSPTGSCRSLHQEFPHSHSPTYGTQRAQPQGQKHTQDASPVPEGDSPTPLASPTKRAKYSQHPVSACILCLGHYCHDIVTCNSITIWDGKGKPWCYCKGKQICAPDGLRLCLDWQLQRSCQSTDHISRHCCSGCGNTDHGAQFCHQAEKV